MVKNGVALESVCLDTKTKVKSVGQSFIDAVKFLM